MKRNQILITQFVIRQLECSKYNVCTDVFCLFCFYLFLIVNPVSCRQVIKENAGCPVPA